MVLPLIPIIGWLAATTAAAIVAPKVAEKAAVEGVPGTQSPISPDTRVHLESGNVQSAVARAQEQARKESLEIMPSFVPVLGGGTIYDLPGGTSLDASKVQKYVQADLIKQGYSVKKAEDISKAVQHRMTWGGYGEFAGAVTAATTGSGLAARGGIAAARAGLASRIGATRTTATVGGLAGAYEGGVAGASMELSRTGQVTPQGVITGAALGGAISAPGTVVLTKAYKKGKTTGTVVDWVGSTAIDPFEKVGDIFGEGAVSMAAKRGRPRSISTGGVTTGQTGSQTASESESPTEDKGKGKTSSESPTPSPTPTPTPTPVSPTPTPTPTETGEGKTPTPEPTPTQTTTSSVTVSPSIAPTATIQPRNLPPLIFPPGQLQQRGAGVGRKGRHIYYDELQRMRRLQGDILYL